MIVVMPGLIRHPSSWDVRNGWKVDIPRKLIQAFGVMSVGNLVVAGLLALEAFQARSSEAQSNLDGPTMRFPVETGMLEIRRGLEGGVPRCEAVARGAAFQVIALSACGDVVPFSDRTSPTESKRVFGEMIYSVVIDGELEADLQPPADLPFDFSFEVLLEVTADGRVAQCQTLATSSAAGHRFDGCSQVRGLGWGFAAIGEETSRLRLRYLQFGRPPEVVRTVPSR